MRILLLIPILCACTTVVVHVDDETSSDTGTDDEVGDTTEAEEDGTAEGSSTSSSTSDDTSGEDTSEEDSDSETDTTGGDLCGNGVIDDGELCDGVALGGASCEVVEGVAGTLACAPDCMDYVTLGCVGNCCTVHGGVGCNVPEIQECVCTASPWCCDNAWDSACVDIAGPGPLPDRWPVEPCGFACPG